MQHAPAPIQASPSDDVLLEGLLQMAVEGHTDEQQFQQIGEEVFTRLLDTYGVEGGPTRLR